MMQAMCDAIGRAFPMTELDCGAFKSQKISGMHFTIRRFYAEGLGNVSAMTASGFLGLMKMDTLIITPVQKDMPLFSYDRVRAMGNDTLIFELYDTLENDAELSLLEEVKAAAKDLPEHDLGEHWYDSIKLPVSLAKKGKKAHTAAFDQCARQYLDAFLTAAQAAPGCEAASKRQKTSVYVEGLLTHGGPSTDVFRKGIGEEKTAVLFRKILFATQQ